MINDRIKGTLGAEDINISWFGPIEIRGLSLSDPKGREVLDVNSKFDQQDRLLASVMLSEAKHLACAVYRPDVSLRST